MNAVVVYESVYGTTRAIAKAIAAGLGGAAVAHVSRAAGKDRVDLLVVGGPTHMHGLASTRSRQVAADAANEDATPLRPEATAQPGLRAWLRDLPDGGGTRARAFDARLDRAPWFTVDSEGPLDDGDLDRAHEWGAHLGRSLAGSTAAAS